MACTWGDQGMAGVRVRFRVSFRVRFRVRVRFRGRVRVRLGGGGWAQ